MHSIGRKCEVMVSRKDFREACDIFREGMYKLLEEGVSFPSETMARVNAAHHLDKVIGMQLEEQTSTVTLLCSTKDGFGYYTVKGEVISQHSLRGNAAYFIMAEETNAVEKLPERKEWIGSQDLFSWEEEQDSQLY